MGEGKGREGEGKNGVGHSIQVANVADSSPHLRRSSRYKLDVFKHGMEHCLFWRSFCIHRGWATIKYIPFASTGLSLSDIAYAMYVVEYLSLISACKFWP